MIFTAELLRFTGAKLIVFGVGLLPLAWIFFAVLTDRLGANPQEYLIRQTGEWGLRFLCLTLLITPLRVISKTPELSLFRRILGLLTYTYAILHLLCYSWFDMNFDWFDISRDIIKRPFILVGISSFVLMTPLALTSFNSAIKRLGVKRWRILHRLIYLISLLVLLHFFWMRSGKQNFFDVFIYAVLIGLLLGFRLLSNVIGKKK